MEMGKIDIGEKDLLSVTFFKTWQINWKFKVFVWRKWMIPKVGLHCTVAYGKSLVFPLNILGSVCTSLKSDAGHIIGCIGLSPRRLLAR